MSAVIRIGTCSFADDSLSRLWYPPGTRTGEQRLRYYAERFDTVEIDSTYYTLPDPETTARWAGRTPRGFVFHIKAFAAMTRHPVRLEQLPPDLREAVSVDSRGRVERPSDAVRGELFARFRRGIEPLRAAGKLGGVLLQFPPYVVRRPEARAYLLRACELLEGETVLVEFRHRSWLEETGRRETLAFLHDLGAEHVVVDAPRTEARNVVPTVAAVTGEVAYVRMHGRNAATWNIRGRSAAERFDYLYTEAELREWVQPLARLAAESREAYVLFNNNGRSPASSAPAAAVAGREWIAQAPTNALLLRTVLECAGVPVSDPTSASSG